jgi:hypothetical protein
MLKVCIIVDVEEFLSLKQGNPRWNKFQRFKGRINNIIKNFRYDKKGFDKIYDLILKERFPISFMLVGSLFKPREKEKFIDYGYHTLNHLPLTLINNEKLKREIKNIFNCVGFSPPLWMIEDVKNPDRVFNALKKEKYNIVVYRGIDDGIKYCHYDSIKPLVDRNGIFCLHKSNDFQGNSSRKKMLSIFKDIGKNKDKNAVYCITTHDFVHKNLNNFKWIIKVLKNMQDKKMIKIVNMKRLIK